MIQLKEERYSNGKGRKRNPSDSPEKKQEYAERYKAKDVQKCLALGRARDERWRQNNLEKSREQSRIRAQEWRENNPEGAKAVHKRFRENHNDRLRARKSPRERAGDLLNRARKRCREKGLPFDLDKEDIVKAIERGVCEITGCPFILNEGKNMFAPSLDRNKGELGYIRSNVRVVVWCYNAAKSIGTDEEVITMAKYLLRTTDGGQEP